MPGKSVDNADKKTLLLTGGADKNRPLSRYCRYRLFLGPGPCFFLQYDAGLGHKQALTATFFDRLPGYSL